MRIALPALLLVLFSACTSTLVKKTAKPDSCQGYYQAADFAEAKKQCAKAADKGEAEGHYYLAKMAEQEKDDWRTYRHYQQAAQLEADYKLDEQRSLQTLQKTVARMISQHEYAQAVIIVKALAANNAVFAQKQLGDMYLNGHGLVVSQRQALYWYDKARRAGHDEATNAFNMVKQQLFLQASKAYKSAHYKAAFKTFEALANYGHKGAKGYLADSYLYGRGVQKNTPQAASWYRQAADQGGAYEAFQLARLLQQGEGIARDQEQAFKYFRQAAQAGHEAAYLHVAMLYARGEGVALDYAKARYWYQKAIQQEDANISFYNLAYLYQLGLGGAQDLDKAQALYSHYQPQADPVLQQRLLDLQQMRQLALKHPDSPVLFQQKLYGARRISMQMALKAAGFKAERENLMYWADHYKAQEVFPGVKELYAYYSHTADTSRLGSQSDLLAQLEYIFGTQPRKHIDKIKRLLSKQYGQPSAAYGRLSGGDMLYQWQLDGVLIQLYRSGLEMELRLSYQIADVYPVMLQEIKRQKKREELKTYQGTKHEL